MAVRRGLRGENVLDKQIMSKIIWLLMGPFKDDVTAKLMVLAPPPPLSPFVTYLVVPPPPYVTEPNGDKLSLDKIFQE